jgi:hypothetical protein
MNRKAGKVSKASVNYRWTHEIGRRCGTCAMFIATANRCTLVAGRINTLRVCDRYTPEK